MAGYFEAGEHGHVDRLAEFVEAERDLMVADPDGLTLLHLAAKNGHLEACRILIESGRVDLEAQDREGRTALHWACHEGHVQVGRFLEGLGAATDIADSYGRMPLSYLPQKAKMTGARGGPSDVPKLDGRQDGFIMDTLQPGHTIYAQGGVAQLVNYHIAKDAEKQEDGGLDY